MNRIAARGKKYVLDVINFMIVTPENITTSDYKEEAQLFLSIAGNFLADEFIEEKVYVEDFIEIIHDLGNLLAARFVSDSVTEPDISKDGKKFLCRLFQKIILDESSRKILICEHDFAYGASTLMAEKLIAGKLNPKELIITLTSMGELLEKLQ